MNDRLPRATTSEGSDAHGHHRAEPAAIIEHSEDALVGQDLTGVIRQARVAAERSRRRLAEVQERFRIAFDHAPIGIALTSMAPVSTGCFLEVNPALCHKLGYPDDELLGRSFADFIDEAHRMPHREAMRALLEGETGEARTETRCRRRDGSHVWLEVRASVVRDGDGRPLYTVAHFQDVTAAREHEEKLRYLADHDGLTGLVNRRFFEERLDALLEDCRRFGRPAAVLVVDLDNFKRVNDAYGHAVGDELLRRVATALSSRLRQTDVVGRLGGDEFGVLLPGVTAAQARAVASDMLHAVDAETGAPAGGGRVRVTASVGINPIDPRAGLSAEALLVDADIAMYQAKETGRNRLAVASGDDRGDSSQRWCRRVHEALTQDGLELWEQPLLNLASGRCDRSEVLVRLKGREGEAIPAADFLPIVERFGQVQGVDRWVVARAVELLAERQASGCRHGLDINLSAISVADERVMDFIRATVSEAPVDPRRITFEITETAAIADFGVARRLMGRLVDLGCRFALDDFGAGYGCLRQLKHLPFSVVKIDGDFISRLPESRFDQLAVRSTVEIAQGLGQLTVAERVGDDFTLDLLREYGVDYAQGFHVARPRRTDGTAPLRSVA